MSATRANEMTVTPAEAELLLRCARTIMDAESSGRIKALLHGQLNWESLISTALQHRILPLFCWHISNTGAEDVPKDVLNQLALHLKSHTERSCLLNERLLSLLNLFEEHEIPVVPYKGPLLATIGYGSFAELRQFRDLDILVHKRDVLRAKALLTSRGYRLSIQLSPEQEAVQLESGYMYKFLHPDEDIEVELHWGFTSKRYSFPLDPEHIWKRVKAISFKGKQVLSFAPDDLLLLVCVHMARHSTRPVFWIRLQMICDIAELTRVTEGANWMEVMDRAAVLRSRRSLLFGLWAASALLGAELPEQVLHRLENERTVKLLVSQMRERLFLMKDESPWKAVEALIFYLRTRERWRDRIQYLFPTVRHLLTPNAKDRATLPLPSFLSFLYYIVRPVRVLNTYGLGPLRHNRKQIKP